MSAAHLHVLRATDFPESGDDEPMSLGESQWDVFDPDFAELLRQDYPGVWSKGGNILGNTQYRRLRPVVERGGEPVTETEVRAVRLREAWGARHAGDFRLPGVVAQVKWFVVGSRGERHMKSVLREAMAAEDADRAARLTPRQRAEAVTLCPPAAVRAMSEATGTDGVSLLHIAAAQRIQAGAVTLDDLHDMVEHGDDAPLLGGVIGSQWARAELARVSRATPLGFLAPRQAVSLDTDEARADYWAEWIRTVHGPSERWLRVMFADWLSWWADAIASRVPTAIQASRGAMATRILSEIELLELLGATEAGAKLRDDVGPMMQRVVELAFRRCLVDMSMTGQLQWSPTISPVEQRIGDLIVQITDTTREAVARIVRESAEAGISTQEIQRRLIDDAAFGRARALTIARTETGRLVTQGTTAAMRSAVQVGAELERQWISARDAAVRPSHQAMDGKTVGIDEPWHFPSGVPTDGPGQSGDPAEDINCRCAARPIVKKEIP